jgi:hypothetical protein
MLAVPTSSSSFSATTAVYDGAGRMAASTVGAGSISYGGMYGPQATLSEVTSSGRRGKVEWVVGLLVVLAFL